MCGYLFQFKGIRSSSFYLALDKVVQDAGIQTSGTTFNRPEQILASADDKSKITKFCILFLEAQSLN